MKLSKKARMFGFGFFLILDHKAAIESAAEKPSSPAFSI